MKKPNWIEKNGNILLLLSVNVICFYLLMKIDYSIEKQGEKLNESIKELYELIDEIPPVQQKSRFIRSTRNL